MYSTYLGGDFADRPTPSSWTLGQRLRHGRHLLVGLPDQDPYQTNQPALRRLRNQVLDNGTLSRTRPTWAAAPMTSVAAIAMDGWGRAYVRETRFPRTSDPEPLPDGPEPIGRLRDEVRAAARGLLHALALSAHRHAERDGPYGGPRSVAGAGPDLHPDTDRAASPQRRGRSR